MPFWVFLWGIFLFSACGWGQVYPSEVLILVNENSATSRYIAKLYRVYHPQVPQSQVLSLSGLADCSGPTSTAVDEIVTREQYEQFIAEPVRAFLIDNDLVNTVKVIVTTAGLPYRIEDTSYGYIVEPGASGGYTGSQIFSVDAASVESELAVLFQNDPCVAENHRLPIYNRAVNPYQGYRNSGVERFERDILWNAGNLNWLYPRRLAPSHYPALMEGTATTVQGVSGRHFSAGDVYLTCRLDGSKKMGQSAVFAVRAMLERAKRASSPTIGVNAAKAVAVFDDSPNVGDYNYSRIYNLDYTVPFIVYEDYTQQPPDTFYREERDDYDSGFFQMSGAEPNEGVLNQGYMSAGHDVLVVSDKRPNHRTNQSDLGAEQTVIAAAGFGRNGDEGSTANYPFSEGPDGGNLFTCSNGAVFTSIESYQCGNDVFQCRKQPGEDNRFH
jgi:hypothetical protein